ncbi:MAG TPA: DUF1549 domain-containing protein [Verrucomicrobiaceae bacterium]
MIRSTLRLTLVTLLAGPGLLVAAPAQKPAEIKAAARQIDSILAADWKKNHLQPNAPASDQTFVRRIYLDLTGRIPTYRETEQFLDSKDPNKRAKLIDQLLAGEGYTQHFFNYWADILRAQTAPQNAAGGISGLTYTQYIKDSLRNNKPYDQFVREMVSAQGKAWDNGAIGYYMRDRNMPLDNMATTVRIFLGTRVECAQCHNHPFDKWTQKQFYEMAAFTYGVTTRDYDAGPLGGARKLMNDQEQQLRQEMKNAPPEKKAELAKKQDTMREDQKSVNYAFTRLRDPLRYIEVGHRDAKLQLPHDYKYPDAAPKSVVQAATMMGKPVDCPPGASGMEAYAEWMTSRDNPRFTNLIANRLWKKVFGLGLIEPVDELMDNTVAMNPELMKHLERMMQDLNYDMKAYLRVLYNTQAYQRDVSREEVPAGVVYHFTGPILRRMTAEQMWDSFVALINPTPDMPNAPAREATEKRIQGVRKLSDSLDTLQPQEVLDGALQVAEKYRAQAERLKTLQKEIAEAKANDDKEKAKELGKEVGRSEQRARAEINQKIFVPAVQRLQAKVAGKESTVSPSDESATDQPIDMKDMSLMAYNPEQAMGKIAIPGYDLPKKSKEELRADEEHQKDVMLDEAAYFGVPAGELKSYIKARQQQEREWLRSAEISSPAPRGHALREFGQSDREVVENANADASVPQVLSMMNSDLLPKIMDKYSQLMLTIKKAKYPDDEVKAAYLTLLSREPTEKEKHLWLEAQDKGLSTIEDLVYALINTQQFIFVQ